MSTTFGKWSFFECLCICKKDADISDTLFGCFSNWLFLFRHNDVMEYV